MFGLFRRLYCRLALICIVGLFVCLPSWALAADRLLSQPGATFTMRVPRRHWTLIAYGDTRFTDPADTVDSSPQARRELIQAVAQEKPVAVLVSGDLPMRGVDPSDYDVYSKETAIWRKEGIKIIPALGNHELAGCNFLGEISCLENWWKAFPELRDRRWYSVHMGQVYILTLDSNMDLMPGSLQAEWIAEQLRDLPAGVRFVLVSLHHPPIADSVVNDTYHNARPNEQALAQQLEAAAARHGDIRFVVIAGHIHNYERFEEGGVEYLVAGGGGATPYRVVRTPKDLYQDNSFPNYHYVKFFFDRGRLIATMYRLKGDGTLVANDRFELRAGGAHAAGK